MTPSLAARIGRLLFTRGLTQDDAAQALGVSRFSVSQLVNGRRSMTAEMAIRFEAVFEISAEQWLRWQMAEDLAAVRQRTTKRRR